MREAELGLVSRHQANWINGNHSDWCDYLIGVMSAAEYASRKAAASLRSWHLDDPFGLNAGLDIDWTSANFVAASQGVLAARFWETQDIRYANRYIDLIHEFATDGRAQHEALSLEQRLSAGVEFTSRSAGTLLDASLFLNSVVTSLAIIAKSLDDGVAGRTAEFRLSTTADTARPSADVLGRVDSGKMAETARSLAEMFFDGLLAQYSDAGRIPNQRMEGLAAIAKFVEIFEDIPEIAAFRPRLEAGLQNLFDGLFKPDGGMLEHSLSYNNGTAAMARQILDLMPDAPWARHVEQSLACYELLKRGARNTVRNHPADRQQPCPRRPGHGDTVRAGVLRGPLQRLLCAARRV